MFWPQHLRCWDQNTSRIQILRHFEKRGRELQFEDHVLGDLCAFKMRACNLVGHTPTSSIMAQRMISHRARTVLCLSITIFSQGTMYKWCQHANALNSDWLCWVGLVRVGLGPGAPGAAWKGRYVLGPDWVGQNVRLPPPSRLRACRFVAIRPQLSRFLCNVHVVRQTCRGSLPLACS